MDLRTWVADDHASLERRFTSSIAAIVPTERWTEHADSGGSTIAWLIFHTAYHQDLALNTAIRKHPPIVLEWRARLGLDGFAPWEGLTESENATLVDCIDVIALDGYARAVHAATAAWIDTMSVLALDSVPESSERLARLAGVGRDDVPWLHAMWDGKPVSWLVQWECIGHGHTHLGEMVSVRNRLGLSPF